MKKIFTVIAVMMLLAGCTVPPSASTPSPTDKATAAASATSPTGTPTSAIPAQTSSAIPTVPSTVAATITATVAPTAAAEISLGPALPAFSDGRIIVDTVGVDALGRTLSPMGNRRPGKYVGCFYWVWHGQHPGDGIFDISKLLDQAPDDLWNTDGTPKSPLYSFHWWGEPLYGYYSSTDEWVIRRHMELLAAAGVDFIAFDLTNSVTYINVIKKVMSVIAEYRAEGFDCPQVTAFTHINSKAVVEELYNEIYSIDYCREAWWCPYDDGKPYMIAYADPDREGVVTRSGVKRGQFSSEIASFFHFKDPQWPDEDFYADSFPWIDWERYPQADHNGVISVSPAVGPGAPMSHALLWPNPYRTILRGRGWTEGRNAKNEINSGSFFRSQWDYAIENDPEIIFVDGWNEWIAQKLVMNPESNPEVFFADAVNAEFSRDCEMLKGGYADNFFMQMAENIRAFKGDGSFPTVQASSSSWKDTAIYRDFGSANIARKARASWGPVVYRQDAARVNIQEIRVRHDADNLYFRIEAENDIGSPSEDRMNLFIGTGKPSAKGWEGYEYVVNRTADTVDKLNADFTVKKAGDCRVTVDGTVMYITLNRSQLGLDGDFSFYFKVADSISNPSDINDYYVSGQSVPMGRLSFFYRGTD